MSFTKTQLTSYAHEYLQGSNLVPIGALDDPFFKAEVQRLWGPKPTQAELERQRKRNDIMLGKLLQARAKLLGPRGGEPKSGVARQQFKQIQEDINYFRRSL